MSQRGEQEFAVSDLEYNLITTLSNLLQAEDVLERYKADADEAGEPEIAGLLDDLRLSNKRAAKGLRAALARLIQQD